MKIDKNIIERLDQMIRFKETGSPSELAKKLQISERQLYRTIKDMKELGCPIIYDNYLETYKYEVEGSLTIKFQEKYNNEMPCNIIHTEELKRIKGGFFKNILLTDWRWQWNNLYL